ncbi:DUF6571 family protein [Actinomyces glycerinitolerans]|uniref:DUF6571 domain-containing protein n=1 Tax=Actinomyces glycerinitolerans TaxID=1892869 RepID=A0A1M4RX04_9ACTO|nr:DUF6571 family protein [Actinomyces glycerinitolerans]SHE24492.1 Hypothetical protein ACGLYG10_0696 [Actinomyces glycerinitolerans]
MKQRTISFRLAAAVLVLLMTCAPLEACSLGSRGDAFDIPGFDMRVRDSEANAQAALEYLAPDGEISDGWWVPGERTRERWETLAGSWDSSTLEELTAAMAAASTMRGSPDEETAAAATWVTARSIEFAVDQVPPKNYTDTMKQNLAALLGNSPDEVVALAGGESLESSDLYGLSGLVTDAQFETALYRVIDNENAADTLVTVMLSYHHNQIDEKIPTAADPETTLLGLYQSAAQTMGYLDGITELHTNNNSTSDTINAADMNTVLTAQAYVDAAQYGLLSEETLEAAATGNNGGPFSFYTEVDGQPTITAPNPITPETAHSYINWRTLVNDSVMISIDSDINTGHSLGYANGQAAEVIK